MEDAEYLALQPRHHRQTLDTKRFLAPAGHAYKRWHQLLKQAIAAADAQSRPKLPPHVLIQQPEVDVEDEHGRGGDAGNARVRARAHSEDETFPPSHRDQCIQQGATAQTRREEEEATMSAARKPQKPIAPINCGVLKSDSDF